MEPAIAKIESFAELANNLEVVLDKFEAALAMIEDQAVKFEAAMTKIDDQATEIAALKAQITVNEHRISKNAMTADIAQRLANSNAQYWLRESAVVKMISASGVKVVASDFHAVHHKKNRKVVIAKLKCRKKAREIVQKRASMKKKHIKIGEESISLDNIKIYESMCDYNAFL